jgi:hypothetical protein
MSANELRQKANETVGQAGIAGERGLAVQVGFKSSSAGTFDDVLGDVIPGASMLVNGARRVVLVTDRNVHLFRGPRYDRPRERLGTWGTGPTAMSFDGKKVTFPDGQTVYLSQLQAQTLMDAAGLDTYAGAAEEVLARAGISGERGVLVERGTVPKAPTTSVGGRVFDVTLGGGELDFRQTSEHRIVLVTNVSVHLFEDRGLLQPGAVLGTYAVGAGVVSRDNARLTFHDGQFIDCEGVGEASRVADAAAGIVG